jgi:hypothetical protein
MRYQLSLRPALPLQPKANRDGLLTTAASRFNSSAQGKPRRFAYNSSVPLYLSSPGQTETVCLQQQRAALPLQPRSKPGRFAYQ